MNTKKAFECGRCWTIHTTEEAAQRCHTNVYTVYECGNCHATYTDQKDAETCCTPTPDIMLTLNGVSL
jgi:hypothetical protein